MLENMNRLKEKMDSLNKSLSIYAPKHKKNNVSGGFSEALNAAMTGNNIPAKTNGCLNANTQKQLGKSVNEDVKNLVEKYSKEYNIQPNLVNQLISAASGNKSNTNANSGAGYLSQLLPNSNSNSGLPLSLGAYNINPLTLNGYNGLPQYLDTKNFVNQVVTGLNNKLGN